MNKKVIMVNIAAIMASNIALAGQDQSVVNSSAKVAATKSNQVAYGCFNNGQGRVGCEGEITHGCIGSGSDQVAPIQNNCAGAEQGSQSCQGSQQPGSCGGNQQQNESTDKSMDDGLN